MVSALATSRTASAADCIRTENSIFGAGGSAITPVLAKVAAALRKAEPPIIVYYSDPSACTGYQQFLDNKIVDTKIKFWDQDGKVQECSSGLGIEADFSTMATKPELCPGQTLPAGVGAFEGPIQTTNILTGWKSSQTSVSAEALYFIFGAGAWGDVKPWVDESAINVRDATSAVQLLTAKAIGVQPTAFLPTATKWTSNGQTITEIKRLNSIGKFEEAIGFASGPNVDKATSEAGGVKTLAYQHFGQSCGYLPDSEPGTPDKLNVRNGQYYLWSSNQFFARVESGKIKNPLVEKLVRYFTLQEEAPGVDIKRVLIEEGNVPQCAMRVLRTEDLGAVASYAPPKPCGCYFESIALKKPTCDACVGDEQCGGNGRKCHFGFCEAY
jgi:hypothetical protein